MGVLGVVSNGFVTMMGRGGGIRRGVQYSLIARIIHIITRCLIDTPGCGEVPRAKERVWCVLDYKS